MSFLFDSPYTTTIKLTFENFWLHTESMQWPQISMHLIPIRKFRKFKILQFATHLFIQNHYRQYKVTRELTLEKFAFIPKKIHKIQNSSVCDSSYHAKSLQTVQSHDSADFGEIFFHPKNNSENSKFFSSRLILPCEITTDHAKLRQRWLWRNLLSSQRKLQGEHAMAVDTRGRIFGKFSKFRSRLNVPYKITVGLTFEKYASVYEHICSKTQSHRGDRVASISRLLV